MYDYSNNWGGQYMMQQPRQTQPQQTQQMQTRPQSQQMQSQQMQSQQQARPSNRTDFGPDPFVTDIVKATMNNNTYRTILWTGTHLQLSLMSIPVGDDVGLEVHPNVDQFFRIESGQGLVRMGNTRDNLYFSQPIYDDSVILVPAGTWHNVINTGNTPLKLYTIYGPPNHPWGTVQQTKPAAE